MSKVSSILLFLCLINLSCKAQVEIAKTPSAKVVDAFYSSDTTLMAGYIKDGLYPIGYKPHNRISPIEAAIYKNRIDIVAFLINNVGLDVTNEAIYSILDNEKFDIEAFNALLSLYSRKDKKDITEWEEEYLDESLVSRHHYFRFKLMIMYGIDLISVVGHSESRTSFYISIIKNEDMELLDLLNYEDEAFNGHTCYGPTVLTAAVHTKNHDLVKYLVDKGLDKTVREFAACYDDAVEGQNAYEIAEGLGCTEIMDLLK